jgi:putative membrane protein
MEKEIIPQQLAGEQTNWAHERTRLAKERTFAAWLRTALATIGVGLAIAKLLPSVEPQWLIRVLGILFVVSGGVMIILGFRAYHDVLKKLEKEGFKGISTWFINGLTLVLLLGTIIGLVFIFLE